MVWIGSVCQFWNHTKFHTQKCLNKNHCKNDRFIWRPMMITCFLQWLRSQGVDPTWHDNPSIWLWTKFVRWCMNWLGKPDGGIPNKNARANELLCMAQLAIPVLHYFFSIETNHFQIPASMSYLRYNKEVMRGFCANIIFMQMNQKWHKLWSMEQLQVHLGKENPKQ